MTTLHRILSGIYGLMVQCYPGAIRAEFGEEMQAVFQEASMHASQSSRWGVLVIFLKELLDWPFELLRGYLDSIRTRSALSMHVDQPGFIIGDYDKGRGGSMTSKNQLLKMNKRQAAIAALPPLLLGLGIMVSALIRTDVWYRLPTWQLYLSIAIVLLAGIKVGIVGLTALTKRIPDWSMTWVGCALMGVTLFAKVVVEEGVDEGWISLSPTVEVAMGLMFFLTGLVLLLLIAWRGWPQAGLFTIAVACTMGLSLFQSLTAAPFNRDDIALFAGPLGLIFSILIYVYILQSGTFRIVIIAGVGLVNTVIALIATNTWSSWLDNRGAPSPLLPLLVILTGLLLSGPVSGLILRSIKRLGGGKKLA